MKNKIFSLPLITLGIVLYGGGYYWGVAIKQSKVISVRLDQKYSVTPPVRTTDGAVSQPTTIKATSTPKVPSPSPTSKPAVTPKIIPAPIVNKTATPAKITPAPVTPAPVTPAPVTPAPVTPVPVVTQPIQEPATVPSPTTKVS